MTAKDLKNALLQEAVQGKLVPQIASEGNARDLLEEIRKERLSHGLDFANAKSGKKSKKETALAGSNPCDIPEDEIPFDIPESWCWCRQSDIANISTGMTPLKSESRFYENGNIPWITSSLTNNEYIENAEYFITEYAVENTTLTLYPKNTLILAMYGQGKTRGQISELLIPATINQACAAIELFLDDEYLRKYNKLFHNWNYNNVRKEASGSAQPNLNLGKVQSTLIPLPPLAEQKRIVAAIEKFMPLIEEYGKKETVLNELNAQIGTLTKKAILQEAVQGKLVPQIDSEGNAKDLLEEIKVQKAALIKEGKIKKDKAKASASGRTLPEITEDEIPFDIPENWCWCRLGEVVSIARGGSPRPIQAYLTTSEDSYNWIKIGDTEKDSKYINSTKEKIRKEGLHKTRLVHKGDFLLTNSMSFGRPYILNIDGCIHDGWLVFSDYQSIFDKDYLYYVLSSTFAYSQFSGVVAGGVVKNLNTDKVASSVFPLPPLSEQKRIVAAIEQLLPLCEKLGR